MHHEWRGFVKPVAYDITTPGSRRNRPEVKPLYFRNTIPLGQCTCLHSGPAGAGGMASNLLRNKSHSCAMMTSTPVGYSAATAWPASDVSRDRLLSGSTSGFPFSTSNSALTAVCHNCVGESNRLMGSTGKDIKYDDSFRENFERKIV